MRVVVYASASSETPASFLEQAGELGKLLAQGVSKPRRYILGNE